MIRWRAFLVMRLGILALAGASVAMMSVPAARHMAGIVVLDASPPPSLPTPSPQASVDTRAILEFAPFGRIERAEAASDASTEAPPDLHLKGIFASGGAASVAMIAVAQDTGLFRLGQNVTDTLELTRITAQYVELADAEQTIVLGFDEAEITSKPQGAGDQVAHSASLIDRFSAGLVVPARYEAPKAPETTAEYIDYWRARIRKNPQAVLDEIGLTPTENGYVIASQHDVGVRLAGLKPGDLVRSVNGQPVGNPDDDRRFYDRIATSGQARLEVERGGRLLTLSFPLR